MNWSDALAAFEVDQKSRGFSSRTVKNRVQMLEHFARWLEARGDDNLLTVEEIHLKAFLARGILPASMQKNRADLRAFYGFLTDEGLRSDNPAAKLKSIKVPRRKARPYSPEQIEAMLAAGSYRKTRIMLILGFYHGLRAHEIAKFRGEDVDRYRQQLRVEGKGGVERRVPIHPMLLAELDGMPDEGWWFPSRHPEGHISWGTVSTLMRRAKARAGIRVPKLTAHSTRHGFATYLLRGGADIKTVQELLGHASLATTEIYLEVGDETKTDAVHALPAVVMPRRSGRRRRTVSESARRHRKS